MKTITRAELSEEIKAGKVTVVDALPAAPFTTRHLPGAINLTIEDIADAPKVLPDKDAAIVTYSSDTACTRGPELADALSGAGYSNVRNFTDGIADWAAAGLTLESGAPTASEGGTDAAHAEEATIRALVEKWAELERTQNADGFEGLITDQFTGIGPVGFVLDAQQWAGRHRSGDLVNHAFDVADINVAVYGDTAVAHAVETQRTTARGHENNGSFRVGLTFVRSGGDWRIASTQFSGPMIKPGEAPRSSGRRVDEMGVIRLYMTLSLDGYVAGPRDSVDDPMGVGGFRLFNWLDLRDAPGPTGQVMAEGNATRAMISGRRTYEHAGHWQGDHHDGVPIFVLTHEAPDEAPPGSVRFVTDVHECASKARAAAGDADVMVHGAGAAQALLNAGELDELELHVVPVLLGQGRRLFDNLSPDHIELSLVRCLTTPDIEDPAQQVTLMRYAVRR